MYEFYKDYFLLNLKDYPNIGIDLPINQILFALLVGIIIAVVAVNYNRYCMSLMIRRLMRQSAVSEEGAKTLGELGIKSKGVRFLLSSGGRLSRIARRAGEKNYTYEEYRALQKSKGYKEGKIDFDNERFYIAEDRQEEAKHIFDMGSASVLNIVLFSLFLVAIFTCLAFLMPEILTLINNTLS